MKLWNFDALSGDVCCAVADLRLKKSKKNSFVSNANDMHTTSSRMNI
jgi:hypothetical protein